jgi:signal transduction histidine kinase
VRRASCHDRPVESATNLPTDVLVARDRARWLGIGAAGLGLSLAYVVVPERFTVLREFAIYNVVTVGSAVAVVLGVVRYRPRAPLAWTLIGLGLFAWAIGDIVWSSYEVADSAVPYPSTADVFYVAGYPLFISGLAVAVQARRVEWDWKVILDTAAVTLAGALVVWVYVIEPAYHHQGEGWQSKLVSVLYPTSDVVLTGFAVLLFLGTSWRAVSMQLLLVGLAGTLVADLTYYTPSVHGVSDGDAIFLVGLTCFALAALHPSMRALTDPAEEGAGTDSRKRLTMLGCVLAVPFVVLAVQEARGDALHVWAVTVSGVLLVLVALLRFEEMLGDAQRSEDDAHALSRFSAGLLASDDDSQLVATADDAVHQLVRRGTAGVLRPPEPAGTPHAFVAPVNVEGIPVAEVVADVGPRELYAVDGPLGSVASQLALALARLRGLRREQEMVESLREQNERLAELDQMKTRFVSSTSHELRTPLTSMVGYLELVLGGEAGELNEEQRRFLEIVNRNCERLNRLVDDVLFVGRADSDRLTLEPSEVDVGELVRTEVASQEAAARLKDVGLRCDEQQGLPRITGDTTRLTQLVDNLLTNAIKFTLAGGAVTATVTGDDARIRVAVADTGVGIPADEVPRVFERFFRASTSRVASGTGLGLSIAQAIAEAHGGSVSVASDVGAGTTFTVELPVSPAADTPIMRATREKEAATP